MGLDKLPGFVLQPGHRQPSSSGHTVLDIADGALADFDAASHALVPTSGHGVARPVDQRRDARTAVAPLVTDGTEVIGEGVSRAAAVLAYDEGDIALGQVQLGIDALDSQVVPTFNLAQKDVDVHLPGELQIAS